MKFFINIAFSISTLLLMSMSFNANAQWFEAKGQARIINNELEIARQQAVQSAINQALLFSGAHISSVSEISNGLLTSDRFEVRANGSIRHLQLIDETQRADSVSVSIRVDIVDDESQCTAAKSIKTVAMTHFPMRNRQQAVIGSIFELGSATAQHFYNDLTMHRGSFTMTQLLPINQELASRAQPFSGDNNQFAKQLLTQYADSQYLLTGHILDVSMHRAKDKWFGMSSDAPKRQFSLALSLYNGSNGEKIWQKNYDLAATWPYNIRQAVDINSSEFWQSPYGSAISNQLSMAKSDINQALFCISASGRVIKVNKTNNHVSINLGRRHGFKVGDLLSVYHQSTFTDASGIVRQSKVLSATTLEIEQLNEFHLRAKAHEGKLYGDIRLNDLVVKQQPY
ncbi:MAG: flagellar assembly protein T N-terminal domain-containing protein [Psychrobium sp.]|nr:flagellar assembly protein T N-terminal domain-containing protein [Psychrobium sp.]